MIIDILRQIFYQGTNLRNGNTTSESLNGPQPPIPSWYINRSKYLINTPNTSGIIRTMTMTFPSSSDERQLVHIKMLWMPARGTAKHLKTSLHHLHSAKTGCTGAPTFFGFMWVSCFALPISRSFYLHQDKKNLLSEWTSCRTIKIVYPDFGVTES